MKLLLTSEGITNQSISRALMELLEKPPAISRVVYVTTAAFGEPGDKGWIETDANTIRTLGFFSFDFVDISKDPRDKWEQLFRGADIIAFGGGVERYLLHWISKTNIQPLLKELIQTRIYIGLSAGSMATVKKLHMSQIEELYYGSGSGDEIVEGLGFVDFEIRPHLNSEEFPKVRLEYLEKLSHENPIAFYALDDNSAVVIKGDSVTVVSEGEWKKFN